MMNIHESLLIPQLSSQKLEEPIWKPYFVPQFPIKFITNDGMDGWINDPTHIRHECGFIDTILEHIDNTRYVEPIMITIHSMREVYAGPSGVARLWGLTNRRGYTHIPAIVNTRLPISMFTGAYTPVFNDKQLRNYFLLEPKDWGIDNDGKAYWHNQNPNEEQARATLKVSPERLAKFLKCL